MRIKILIGFLCELFFFVPSMHRCRFRNSSRDQNSIETKKNGGSFSFLWFSSFPQIFFENCTFEWVTRSFLVCPQRNLCKYFLSHIFLLPKYFFALNYFSCKSDLVATSKRHNRRRRPRWRCSCCCCCCCCFSCCCCCRCCCCCCCRSQSINYHHISISKYFLFLRALLHRRVSEKWPSIKREIALFHPAKKYFCYDRFGFCLFWMPVLNLSQVVTLLI